MIIIAYRTSNHILAIEIGRWSTIHVSRDTVICRLSSSTGVETEAHFVLECPLCNCIINKFQLLHENGVLGSKVKCFFQSDHEVGISPPSHIVAPVEYEFALVAASCGYIMKAHMNEHTMPSNVMTPK